MKDVELSGLSELSAEKAKLGVEKFGFKRTYGITVTAKKAAKSDKPHRVLGFFAQARYFIDCVKKGKNPRGCLENAFKTMQLVDKIYANSAL